NFNLTPLSAALAVVSGGNFANFTSPDIANFSTTLRAIPEPTLLALFGLGLGAAGIAAARRRRRD
ncbi:MAG: PEP-CTERM sorting domain-containing protein, partial [Acidobacteriota bacterium]